MIDAFNREGAGLTMSSSGYSTPAGATEHAGASWKIPATQFDRDLPGALPRRLMDAWR